MEAIADAFALKRRTEHVWRAHVIHHHVVMTRNGNVGIDVSDKERSVLGREIMVAAIDTDGANVHVTREQ